jgi:hypothetical protein
MRTTLNIDADVLATAKSIAQAQHRSLGEVVSERLRKTFQPSAEHGIQINPPTEDHPFWTTSGTGTIRPEDVRREIEEEGVDAHLELIAQLKHKRSQKAEAR